MKDVGEQGKNEVREIFDFLKDKKKARKWLKHREQVGLWNKMRLKSQGTNHIRS